MWRPEFVKIISSRKFPIEFFVQFAILIFPTIGGILLIEIKEVMTIRAAKTIPIILAVAIKVARKQSLLLHQQVVPYQRVEEQYLLH